jgi:hypothetical protein
MLWTWPDPYSSSYCLPRNREGRCASIAPQINNYGGSFEMTVIDSEMLLYTALYSMCCIERSKIAQIVKLRVIIQDAARPVPQ